MKTKISLLFYLKKPKNYQKGRCRFICGLRLKVKERNLLPGGNASRAGGMRLLEELLVRRNPWSQLILISATSNSNCWTHTRRWFVKMLGHTNILTTQTYAKILDAKVSEAMQALKGRLSRRSGMEG